MNKYSLLIAITVMFLVAATGGSVCATDVGVSVSVGEPGFYGRIDIGRSPRPVVIYSEPVVVRRVPEVVVVEEPIYLRVPPGHEKHWKKHCRKYNACSRPVYFVEDSWYQEVYVPAYHSHRRHHGHHHGHHHRDD